MGIANKIKEVRKVLSLTQKEIEESTGLTQRDISFLENGKKKFIPTEYIQFMNKKGVPLDSLFDEMVSVENFVEQLKRKNAYLNAYPNAYLPVENKASETCRKKQPSEKKYTPEYTPIQIKSSKTSSFAVPFYDIPVSAGPLGVLTYSNGAVEPDGYIDMEIFRRCDAILPVMGVSMEPEIHSGDLIGIRKLDSYNWEYIETGKVYMIVTTEERMIKYINRADDSDYIICSSPNYHDFKIRKDDILEIYRVIANIRAL